MSINQWFTRGLSMSKPTLHQLKLAICPNNLEILMFIASKDQTILEFEANTQVPTFRIHQLNKSMSKSECRFILRSAL